MTDGQDNNISEASGKTAKGSRLGLLRKKLESGTINPAIWEAYFPNLPADKEPSCQDCEAFGSCPFNHSSDPLVCLSYPGRYSS